MEHSKVRRYLDPCQTFNVFGKKFQAIITFAERSLLDHFRCLTGFLMRLYTYKCLIVTYKCYIYINYFLIPSSTENNFIYLSIRQGIK